MRRAHPSAAPGGRGPPAASAGRPVYQRKINPTQQVLDQYRSGGPSNARNSRRLPAPIGGAAYGQSSQVSVGPSIAGSAGPRPSKREPGAGAQNTSAAKHVAQYNSTPTHSNQGAGRPEDFSHPLSHSSQMISQQARPVAAINYKDIVLAEGVEMFQHKQAKKESQSELH